MVVVTVETPTAWSSWSWSFQRCASLDAQSRTLPVKNVSVYPTIQYAIGTGGGCHEKPTKQAAPRRRCVRNAKDRHVKCPCTIFSCCVNCCTQLLRTCYGCLERFPRHPLAVVLLPDALHVGRHAEVRGRPMEAFHRWAVAIVHVVDLVVVVVVP